MLGKKDSLHAITTFSHLTSAIFAIAPAVFYRSAAMRATFNIVSQKKIPFDRLVVFGL